MDENINNTAPNNSQESNPQLPKVSTENNITAPANSVQSPAETAPVPTSNNHQTTEPNSVTSKPVTGSPPSDKKNNLVNKIIIGMAVVGVGIAAYVFGVYLPNTPENVWSRSLDNTGDGFKKVLDEFAKEDKIKNIEKSQVSIDATAKSANYDFNGSANSKFNSQESNSNLKFDAQANGESIKFNLDVITKLPEKSYFPNIYFKFSGLDDIANSTGYATYASLLDDKWIRISSEYLKQFSSVTSTNPEENNEPITSADVAQYINTFADQTNEYIFTNNPEKAVLVNKGYQGEEETEGVKTFKYTVGVNKDNAKKYCVSLTNAILDLPATKKFTSMSDEDIAREKGKTEEDCNQQIKDIEDDYTFDVWINKSQKLLHKARFYESKQDKTTYTDVGQIYKGGDEIELFINYYDESESSEAKLNTKLNTKTFTSTGVFTAEKKGDNGYEVNAKLEIKPYDGEIEAVEPKDFTDFEKLIQQFFGGGF
jgi:hypothetical protein